MSFALFVVDKVLRLRMKRRLARRPDVLELRPIMAAMARERPVVVPADVTVTETEIAGVPVELLSPRDARKDAALLYLHGGGFTAGSPLTHRGLTYRLARALQVPVYVPDYRLAPEHPFPAAVTDVTNVYRALTGIFPGKIAIAGDSAGGNLTLVLAMQARDMGLATPAALVCLSPVTEIAELLPTHRANAKSDAMFGGPLHQSLLERYCAGADPTDPRISPHRGDPTGLPPTLFQCSTIEILRDDTMEMASKMRNAGVDVTVQPWPKVFHVWQIAADLLPEARRAIADVVAFLEPHL